MYQIDLIFLLTPVSGVYKLPLKYCVLCIISVHHQDPNLGVGEAKGVLKCSCKDIFLHWGYNLCHFPIRLWSNVLFSNHRILWRIWGRILIQLYYSDPRSGINCKINRCKNFSLLYLFPASPEYERLFRPSAAPPIGPGNPVTGW